MTNSNREPNRLVTEKSPYLLQHAYNPVDWYPWGEEAFEKAKSEDKPIFLSIGYSTCHWCHVMAWESFEDEEVAEILNNNYISIKVDREERPDIDAVYMNVCQMMTGSGGWPMTIIMTPDKKPFFAGTYFPKRAKYGVYGLIEILTAIAEKWITDKKALIASGNEIIEAVTDGYKSKNAQTEMNTELFHKANNYFQRSFDKTFGGFGNAPKFPTPHNLMFLIRYSIMEKDETALQIAEKTLESMYRGGIFDHIAGGFSRYATDNQWLIPHFEKMLYDNALLIITYLEAYQLTGKKLYKDIVQKTISYISGEMTGKEGGFYSAQDADSEGVEGKYYVFTPQEIIDVLGKESGELFNIHFDITEQGNFEGKSVPNLINNREYDMYIDSTAPIGSIFEDLFKKLYDYRKNRTLLRLDDKVLTSWNALMITAMAKSFSVLNNHKYLILAENAARFLCTHLSDGNGILYVRYRDGSASGHGYLEDYAYTVWAFLTMYEVTFDTEWLDKAILYAKYMVDKFYDKEKGGFFLYSEDSEKLFIRPKETYDAALPSGNSVAGFVLAKIAKITANTYWEALSFKQAGFLAENAINYPYGHSFALMCGMLHVYASKEVVVVLPDDEINIPGIRDLISKRSLYNTVCLVKTPENAKVIEKIAPYTKYYNAKNNEITYYVCKNRVCAIPVHSPDELNKLLSD